MTRLLLAAAVAGLGLGCNRDTSKLTADQEQRFATETIRYRADNALFRFTDDQGWENRVASIVVTGRTVLIHKNEKVGIEITPASQRDYEVHRDHTRVKINAGSGKSKAVWSFEPPSDAEGWTEAIRDVIKASAGAASR